MNTVQILLPNHLLSFDGWVNDPKDGHATPVFTATFFHPQANREIQAYCKPCPWPGKKLFNEIAAWLSTHDKAIAQPEYAFAAFVEKDTIPQLDIYCAHPSYNWINEQAELSLFCASRLDGKTAAVRAFSPEYELTPQIQADIRHWEQLPAAVVLDEIIANTDRHPGNLIRLDAQKYALIDNGNLISETGEEWTAAEIARDKNYSNQLTNILHDGQSACLLFAETAPKLSPATRKALQWWAEQLLTDEEERRKYLEFSDYRENHAPCLLKQRFNQLL